MAPPTWPPFKLAFIGTHGVGKTTLCYGLAARLKRRDVVLDVVHEVARRCPLPVNQQTSLPAQAWIIHTQVSEEWVAAARSPVVLCDRSVLDNYVYLLLAEGRQPMLEHLVDAWLGTYDLLVHVPVGSAPADDGYRAIDPSFQTAVEERLLRELAQRQLPLLSLETCARDNWLDCVEAAVWPRLEPAQLALL